MAEPLALDLTLDVDVKVTGKQEQMAGDVREFLLELQPDLIGRAALVSRPAGDPQVRLVQLAKLLLQLEQELVAVPHDAQVFAYRRDSFSTRSDSSAISMAGHLVRTWPRLSLGH